MSVVREFHAASAVNLMYADLNSLGAHVAAKLEVFASDERTLTDDLCDMFFIWAGIGSQQLRITDAFEERIFSALPNDIVETIFRKTTVFEEANIGADLRLLVITPLGRKEALFQSKAFDPDDGLRVNGDEGWNRLLHQLLDMKMRCPLSFLLLYLPSSLLNNGLQGFSSWEQSYARAAGGRRSSKFGTTLISVDDLLDDDYQWRLPNHLEILADGATRPFGKSVSRLFLELLSCRVGDWEDFDERLKFRSSALPRPAPRVTVEIDFRTLSASSYQDLANRVRSVLDTQGIE
jgi:hypothetical protein